MNGLDGVRVLLLDDKADEAVPVIKAFAREGVGVAYFEGRRSGLPKKADRLTGIRLAVLDIDLGDDATGNSLAAILVQRLGKIISPDNGPYAVILWTNHEEHRNNVKKYLFEHQTLPNPLFTEMITKAECKTGKKFSLDRVIDKIQNALRETGPLNHLQRWEGSCFRAATTVTNTLASATKHAGTDLDTWRDAWKKDMQALFLAIAKARAEKRLAPANCMESIFSTLNPLQADAMENQLPALCTSFAGAGDEIMAETKQVGREEKAKINSMLHLNHGSQAVLAPGNLYAFRWSRTPRWFPKCEDIVEGALNDAKGAEEQKTKSDELCSGTWALALEVSAACDYAQKKVQSARFLTGLVVPNSLLAHLNTKSQFLKVIGPLALNLNTRTIPNGVYSLVLTSRHVASIEVVAAGLLRQFARLRSEALADVQSWLAYQVGRQGMTLLK